MKATLKFLIILFLFSFLYASDSKIIIYGTGDPATSAQIRIGATGENKAYVFCNEIIVNEGASLVVWHPDAVSGAEISGEGTVVYLGPEVDEILQFFDESVQAGTLYGIGRGQSANYKLNALRNMIIEAGNYVTGACEQLYDAFLKTDGLPEPPDFVAGDAAPMLAAMLQDLQEELRCNSIISGTPANPNITRKSQLDLVEKVIPDEFGLAQNYPNPFNPITTIMFAIPQEENVLLEIYNSTGQRVITVTNQRYNAGFYEISWDASNLASGVYLYRLQAGNYIETRKMVLMK